jgi:uncharacterized protein
MDTLCRLMSPELPQTIDPKTLARKGATLEGKYAVRDLHRLGEVLDDHSCPVTFRFEFGQDKDTKHSFITGNIEATLKTVCQRCLDVMELRISCPVYLGVVSSQEEAAGLPDGCEPLLQNADPISLLAFIEDELILALPISAMHDADQCAATRVLHDINTAARHNPFAVLQKLKQKTRNA